MSYAELYKKAKAEGDVKRLNPTFFKWEKKGQMVLGAFVSLNQIQGDPDKPPYNQYVFDTDDGPVKFHVGSVTDGEIAARLRVGNVYRITFQGEEKIKGGRRVNHFDFDELVGAAGSSEADGEAPAF